MKRMKKSLPAATALILMILIVNSSIAYFTSKDKAGNVYTVGSVDIKIDEPSWDPGEDHPIEPGKEHDKDPVVTNTGNNDAYVRIRLCISDYSAFIKHGGNDYDITSMFNIGSKWVKTGGPVIDSEDDTVRFTYTYTEVLPVGKVTEPLFTKVTMPDFIDSDMIRDMDNEFDVTVQADAIQADGFSNYTEAFKAFDERMGG